MLLDTDYYYREDWQYQTIRLDTNDLSIQRAQNYKINGVIQHSTDIISVGDAGWESLFVSYGYRAYIKYQQEKAISKP
mgnify:FL=1|jgi:hypothetical protein